MIACNDHQWTEHNLLVACFLNLFNNSFTCSLFRIAFYCAYEYIVISHLIKCCLHL